MELLYILFTTCHVSYRRKKEGEEGEGKKERKKEERKVFSLALQTFSNKRTTKKIKRKKLLLFICSVFFSLPSRFLKDETLSSTKNKTKKEQMTTSSLISGGERKHYYTRRRQTVRREVWEKREDWSGKEKGRFFLSFCRRREVSREEAGFQDERRSKHLEDRKRERQSLLGRKRRTEATRERERRQDTSRSEASILFSVMTS